MIRTLSLIEEPTPRSRETVEALGRPAVRRIQGYVWFAGGCFVFASLVSCIVVGLLDEPANAVMLIGICGGLPAWAIARFILPDAAVCFDLVREGRAYRATLVAMRRRGLSYSAAPVVSIAWNENGERVLGYVTLVATIEPPDPEDIVVLVRPGMKRIGVVLGTQGLFIGARGSGRFWF